MLRFKRTYCTSSFMLSWVLPMRENIELRSTERSHRLITSVLAIHFAHCSSFDLFWRLSSISWWFLHLIKRNHISFKPFLYTSNCGQKPIIILLYISTLQLCGGVAGCRWEIKWQGEKGGIWRLYFQKWAVSTLTRSYITSVPNISEWEGEVTRIHLWKDEEVEWGQILWKN